MKNPTIAALVEEAVARIKASGTTSTQIAGSFLRRCCQGLDEEAKKHLAHAGLARLIDAEMLRLRQVEEDERWRDAYRERKEQQAREEQQKHEQGAERKAHIQERGGQRWLAAESQRIHDAI